MVFTRIGNIILVNYAYDLIPTEVSVLSEIGTISDEWSPPYLVNVSCQNLNQLYIQANGKVMYYTTSMSRQSFRYNVSWFVN